ncbi:probable glutamate receptor [Polyodon spathula]|uniref:probable glutamate receptor n=1 Tax=Polyodon spathula TaxID=7913 RepID=UPI001B7DF40E|nr:probable glutamate receptor [Polyodon spathula]
MRKALVLLCGSVLMLAHFCAAGTAENEDRHGTLVDARTLRVTTILQEPYIMEKNSVLEGYCIDLMKELSKKLDLKYTIHLVKDGFYGRQDAKGNWNGMVGEVVRSEADLAMASLTITATREKAVELTKPFMQTGISIILRKDIVSSESHFFEFLNPFSKETWIGILIAYLMTSVCLFIVARLSPCEWSEPQTEGNRFTLLHSFWYAAGALTLQGAGPQPKALSVRVISVIWWLFTVVLLASYIASFSSMRNSDSTKLSIETFEDLAKQDIIEYGTLRDSSTFNFFKNSNQPVYRMIYEHMQRRHSLVSSVEEGIRKAQGGSFAFIGESASLDLAVARYCSLTRVPEVIGMRGYAIATSLGSPLVKNLSVAILQLIDAGELDYLREKWWASTCVSEEGGSSAPLNPHCLGGIFFVLGGGLALGVLLALVELALKSKTRAEEQKKSCCSVFSEELSCRFRNSSSKKDQDAPEKSKT